MGEWVGKASGHEQTRDGPEHKRYIVYLIDKKTAWRILEFGSANDLLASGGLEHDLIKGESDYEGDPVGAALAMLTGSCRGMRLRPRVHLQNVEAVAVNATE